MPLATKMRASTSEVMHEYEVRPRFLSGQVRFSFSVPAVRSHASFHLLRWIQDCHRSGRLLLTHVFRYCSHGRKGAQLVSDRERTSGVRVDACSRVGEAKRQAACDPDRPRADLFRGPAVVLTLVQSPHRPSLLQHLRPHRPFQHLLPHVAHVRLP